MLARGALCRLAASKTSAHDLQLASFLQLALVSRNAARLPAVRALSRAYTSALGARRAYATTTSATKPTATVKRAVKAKAAEKTPPKTATRKKAATATATAAKTARKPRAAAATKAKLKPKPKAKKAPKKAAPKKRVKKVATPEEKEKAKITELRRKALREPVTSRALNAYSAFLGDRTRGKKAEAGTQISRVADLAQTWRALTPAEHEHYNHMAREQNEARQAEYRAWILTHTPQEIHAANLARTQLRRILKGRQKSGPAHTGILHDDRQVKRASNPYAFFFGERIHSGDFKNIKVGESAKLVAAEWRALSAGEKKKYEDATAADKERYTREMAAQ